MKRILCVVLAIGLLVFSGCSSEWLAGPIERGETSAGGKQEASAKIDYDLSKMNYNLVSGQISEFNSNMSKYVGKIVRIKGTFGVTKGADRDYYICYVSDTTACCSVGMEFLLKDGKYPEEGAEITVRGRFNTYMEGTTPYCELADASLE